jgi:acyl-CoA reductase-like NAD-dependent aldehyde dehydrogenase
MRVAVPTPPLSPPLELLPDPRPFVGGRRLDPAGGDAVQHIYAATGRATTVVPSGRAAEIDAAVGAAAAARPRWRRVHGRDRRGMLQRAARLLEREADDLATLQTVESGVPLQFARGVPGAAADFLDYYAGWSDKGGGELIDTWPAPALDYALEEPYGIVGVIVPWNTPLVSLAQIAGAALAAGNCVVLKPPELAPFTALRAAELFAEAGLPDGVLNVVPGGPAAGDALVRHPAVGKVHFTGSVDTGRRVLAAAGESLTPVGLELGGKSAHLIFADADPRAAARQALSGLIILSGQGCANGTRVLIEAPLYDEVTELILKRLRRLPVGDPLRADTIVGPVVSQAACARIVGIVERARDAGDGELLTGGERLGGELAEGYFVAPAVFGEVDPASPLAQEEIFGPVLALQRFDDEDEALSLANGTRYGLAGYVHTADLRRAHRVAAGLEVGNVWVNGYYGVPPSMPFGGAKQSGHGRIGGRLGLREFTRPKNVWVAL